MAYLPCSVGHHRYRGKANMFYLAVGQAADFTRWRARLCDDHARVVLEAFAFFEMTDEVTDTQYDVIRTVCAVCDQQLDDSSKQLFLTAYALGEERRDYWMRLHLDCPIPAVLPTLE